MTLNDLHHVRLRTPVENCFWAFACLSVEQKAEFVAMWNDNEALRAHPSRLVYTPSAPTHAR